MAHNLRYIRRPRGKLTRDENAEVRQLLLPIQEDPARSATLRLKVRGLLVELDRDTYSLSKEPFLMISPSQNLAVFRKSCGRSASSMSPIRLAKFSRPATSSRLSWALALRLFLASWAISLSVALSLVRSLTTSAIKAEASVTSSILDAGRIFLVRRGSRLSPPRRSSLSLMALAILRSGALALLPHRFRCSDAFGSRAGPCSPVVVSPGGVLTCRHAVISSSLFRTVCLTFSRNVGSVRFATLAGGVVARFVTSPFLLGCLHDRSSCR
jgi:hypothetical protein